MRLRLVLRGRVLSLFTPGRPAVPTELDRALTETRRTHPTVVERIRAAFELLADGVDPRDVADECTKLGDVLHWRWGSFRMAWFWSPGGELILLELWRKQGMRERRERVERLNQLRQRFSEESHEYLE